MTFVSQASIDNGAVAEYGLKKRIEPVKNCRNVGKKDMRFNDAMPKMKVNPETYVSTMGNSNRGMSRELIVADCVGGRCGL